MGSALGAPPPPPALETSVRSSMGFSVDTLVLAETRCKTHSVVLRYLF